MPHRSPRFARRDERLLRIRLNRPKQPARSIHQQRHPTQIHIRWLRKHAPTQVPHALNKRLNIIRQKVRHPRIRKRRILRLIDDRRYRKSLHARHAVPHIQFLKVPAQKLAIKMRGLTNIRGHQVNPVGHATLSHKSRHYIFLHFSGSKSSSAVASSK